jgi:RNA polymerase sigma-70 factor (ECF subfamily)
MNVVIAEQIIEHIARLKRYARVLINDHQLADDLVQDTLERGIRYASSFRPGSDLRAWLMAIMHNIFVNETKTPARRAARVSVDYDEVSERELCVTFEPCRSLEIRDVDKGLQLLPADQREIILLVCLEEMSYAEVARRLDVPVGTVMSRLSRGRERLRALIPDACASR